MITFEGLPLPFFVCIQVISMHNTEDLRLVNLSNAFDRIGPELPTWRIAFGITVMNSGKNETFKGNSKWEKSKAGEWETFIPDLKSLLD